MTKKKNIQWALVVGAAFAWFGQHCGSGFCSGVQITQYFATCGFLAPFLIVFPFIMLGFAFYFMGEYARRIRSHSYKEVATTLYSDNPFVSRAALLLWDLSVLSNTLISGGAVVAGAATLMETVFHFNYAVGSVIFALFVAAICMFGARGLTRASLPLVGVLVTILLIVSSTLIHENAAGLLTILETRETFATTPGGAFMNMIFYTGLASNFICAYMAIAPGFSNEHETKYMAVIGAIINCVMVMFVALALVSRMPAVTEAKLPVLFMIQERFGDSGIITLLYQLALFLAYLTTGVGNVFAAISRFGELFNKEHKRNQKVVDAVMAIAFLLIAVGVAQFGLAALVDKGYKFLSSMRFPLYVLGGLIFAPYRLRKWKKEGRLDENGMLIPGEEKKAEGYAPIDATV